MQARWPAGNGLAVVLPQAFRTLLPLYWTRAQFFRGLVLVKRRCRRGATFLRKLIACSPFAGSQTIHTHTHVSHSRHADQPWAYEHGSPYAPSGR